MKFAYAVSRFLACVTGSLGQSVGGPCGLGKLESHYRKLNMNLTTAFGYADAGFAKKDIGRKTS